MKCVALASGIFGVVVAVAAPVIDDSPTRVQTTLDPGLELLGVLRPKSVSEISSSRWTLDCAGMDREHADWRAIKEYVAPLGISRIRVQAGWARCEKDPGVYDFAWLDQIVFDAQRQGIKVWMELSYGNPSYPGGGGRQLGAGLPSSKEGLEAWDRWVFQLARRYKGVVSDWCIWNEPNKRRSGITPMMAVEFAIRTAEIVKRETPEASIAAFALSWAEKEYVEPFVKELQKRGKTGLFTSVAYHHYKANPDDGYDAVEECRAVIARYTPSLKMWQGEGGTWSEWGAVGALRQLPWTELKQAKYDLRRSLGDLGHGDDTSVFHICDLEYRTSAYHDGLVRYGLLKTTGQADGYRVLKVKTAYYAIQNAVSIFNDALSCCGKLTTSQIEGLERGYVCDWLDPKGETTIAVFWDASAMPTDENIVKSVRISVSGKSLTNPVWCDLLTGNVYAVPPERVKREGDVTVYEVPAYDSPTFIADRSVVEIVEPWEVTWKRTHQTP